MKILTAGKLSQLFHEVTAAIQWPSVRMNRCQIKDLDIQFEKCTFLISTKNSLKTSFWQTLFSKMLLFDEKSKGILSIKLIANAHKYPKLSEGQIG